MLLLWCWLCCALPVVSPHTLGLHGLGGPAPNSPDIKDVYGAFTVTVMARFGTLDGHFQAMTDFSNGNSVDSIFFGQIANTSGVILTIKPSPDKFNFITAANAIDVGVLTTYQYGVTSDGTYFIKKNGVVVGSDPKGVEFLAPNVPRSLKLLANTDFSPIFTRPLRGAVLGLQIVNEGDPPPQRRSHEFLNFPGQIFTPFVISVYARFDNVTTNRFSQRIFDFGNGPSNMQVSLGQSSNTRDMMLEVNEGAPIHRCTATNAIVEGEMAHIGMQVLQRAERIGSKRMIPHWRLATLCPCPPLDSVELYCLLNPYRQGRICCKEW